MIILLSTLLLVIGLIVTWFAAKTTANGIHAKQMQELKHNDLLWEMAMKRHEDLTDRFYDVTDRFESKYSKQLDDDDYAEIQSILEDDPDVQILLSRMDSDLKKMRGI